MRKLTALTLLVSVGLLAGCSSMHGTARQWEYKVAQPPVATPPGTRPVGLEQREQFLNQLGKEGWVLVAADGDLFYLKRPAK